MEPQIVVPNTNFYFSSLLLKNYGKYKYLKTKKKKKVKQMDNIGN